MSDRDTSDNPYSIPQTLDVEVELNSDRSLGMSLKAAWRLMVLFNLPIPLFFGFLTVRLRICLPGMPVGIAIIYALGVWSCSRVPSTMKILNAGAVVTALSQFWPVLHIFIGSGAIAVSRGIVGEPARSILTEFVFVVLTTILTGTGLILVSFVPGVLFAGLAGTLRRR